MVRLLTKKHRHPALKDAWRALPPDEQGRNRYLDENGYIRVCCGLGHPVAAKNGYTNAGRLKMFESGRLLPDQQVWYKDGNKMNLDLDNLVAYGPGDPRPWITEVVRAPLPCLCGCGELAPIGKTGKPCQWIKGHKARRNPFHHLPVTRERKRQLWNTLKGLCHCGAPLTNGSQFCDPCREKKRERARRRVRERYESDPGFASRQSTRWVAANLERVKNYQALRAQYGNKRDWPDDIKRYWAAKYPSRLSKILAAVREGGKQ